MVILAEENIVNHKGQHQGTGQYVSSLLCITDDRGRWALIAADTSVGVSQQHLGIQGIKLVSYCREAERTAISVLD